MKRSDRCQRIPDPQGLYHPRNEHDACGMGLVASIRGEQSHEIIRKGLEVLINLTHRGAAGCDPETGDGAGILIQIPHDVLRSRSAAKLGMQLGEPRQVWCGHGVPAGGQAQPPAVRRSAGADCAGRGAERTGLARHAGKRRFDRASGARHAAVHRADVYGPTGGDGRRTPSSACSIWCAGGRRTRLHNRRSSDKEDFYIPSLSCRTIVYKGLMLAPQIEKFYYELANPLVASALCLVHQRFSTNTFPSWKLAHPYRYMCAQRRDQHHSRQCELDERAPVCAGQPALRRADREAVSGDFAGRKRLGFAGQRGGVSFSVGAHRCRM